MNKKSDLLKLIDEKLSEAKAKQHKKKPRKPTRAEINKENSDNSTGPRTPEGKQRSAANSLKHGFFAHIEKLHPEDSRAYIEIHENLREGLQPDGPAEEQLIEELSMLRARLQRLEAIEYSLIVGNIEGAPEPLKDDDGFHLDPTGERIQFPNGQFTARPDSRSVGAAFQQTRPDLEALNKIETNLRRTYNRTWDRLERMQRERHKMPLDEALKRSQIWLTYYHQKANIDAQKDKTPDSPAPDRVIVPARHPALDEKGKFIKYEKGHPLHRPKEDDEKEELDDRIDPAA